jgi:hypothetical protein
MIGFEQTYTTASMMERLSEWILGRWSEGASLTILTSAWVLSAFGVRRKIRARVAHPVELICNMSSDALPIAALCNLLLGALVTSIHGKRLRRTRSCDSQPRERLLDPGCEPPLGAHMITPRHGYRHHGIYVGGGSVVQYGGRSLGAASRARRAGTLVGILQGRPVWVRGPLNRIGSTSMRWSAELG